MERQENKPPTQKLISKLLSSDNRTKQKNELNRAFESRESD